MVAQDLRLMTEILATVIGVILGGLVTYFLMLQETRYQNRVRSSVAVLNELRRVQDAFLDWTSPKTLDNWDLRHRTGDAAEMYRLYSELIENGGGFRARVVELISFYKSQRPWLAHRMQTYVVSAIRGLSTAEGKVTLYLSSRRDALFVQNECRVYTVDEAARVLDTSEDNVRMLVKMGAIEAVHTGGRLYVLLPADPKNHARNKVVTRYSGFELTQEARILDDQVLETLRQTLLRDVLNGPTTALKNVEQEVELLTSTPWRSRWRRMLVVISKAKQWVVDAFKN